MIESGVERGRFAAAGRTGHENHAEWQPDYSLEKCKIVRFKAKFRKVELKLRLVQYSENNLLSEIGGERRDTDINYPAILLDSNSSVLRSALLCNIKASHYLQTENN